MGQPNDDDDFGLLPFDRINEKETIYLNGVIKRVL